MRADAPGRLALGFGTGVAFGALLREGGVARFDVILDQLRLADGRVVKVMGTAAAVGAVGVHALVREGYAKPHVKPLRLGGVIGGAVLFGAGLALLGYCPGTALAATGRGRWDAMAGVLGMLAGAGLFVRAYPALKPTLERGDYGKETLPRATGTSPWPWVAGLGLAVLAGAAASERPWAPPAG